MVELDVEARQGDSGGPIFNQRGELAGVLFGAGQGTTIGSFAPRVESFLASLAPDIGASRNDSPNRRRRPAGARSPLRSTAESQSHRRPESPQSTRRNRRGQRRDWPSSPWNAPRSQRAVANDDGRHSQTSRHGPSIADSRWFDGTKSTSWRWSASIAVALQLMRLVK